MRKGYEKQIFSHNRNWDIYELKRRRELRDVEVKEVRKMLKCGSKSFKIFRCKCGRKRLFTTDVTRELLTKRDELNVSLQKILDKETDAWGIKVSSVTVRDVSLPEEMLRAIAKQAEAERERRSRVIMAQGEFEAAKKMAEAATQYQENLFALRLRELQTLTEIARKKNMVVVSPTKLGTSSEKYSI